MPRGQYVRKPKVKKAEAAPAAPATDKTAPEAPKKALPLENLAFGMVNASAMVLEEEPGISYFVGIRKMGHSKYKAIAGRIKDGAVVGLKEDNLEEPLEHAAFQMRHALANLLRIIP